MKLEFHDFKTLSLNQWYSGNHWSKRTAVKDEWHWRTKEALQNCPQETFEDPVDISVTCWLKRPIDPDNSVIYAKLIIDALCKEGILKDDTYKEISSVTLKVFKAKENSVVVNIK